MENPMYAAALEYAIGILTDKLAELRGTYETPKLSLVGQTRRGRPPGYKVVKTTTPKRTLSPAARKAIGDAQKRRWAAKRKETPSTPGTEATDVAEAPGGTKGRRKGKGGGD